MNFRTVPLKKQVVWPLTTLKPWSRQSGDRLYPEKTCQEAERGKAGFVVYYTNYSLVIDSDISNIKNVQD